MPFYEINYIKYGTALIEADNEEEVFEYLQSEPDYDEAELENELEHCPRNKSLYEPFSVEHKY